MSSSIRQMVTYGFRVYIPPYSQGRVQLTVQAIPVSGSVSVNFLSADILSAGINVGSFMFEYALGNRYQWAYSSSVAGSSYRDTAYLDLGVVTNTGRAERKRKMDPDLIPPSRCIIDATNIIQCQ